MKQLLGLSLLLSYYATASASSINIVHYNIKELDSTKLRNKNIQLRSVKYIIDQYKIDLLSINELQFDIPNSPNSQFTSYGENLKTLARILGVDENLKFSSFFQANTGNNAQRTYNGDYVTAPNSYLGRRLADPVNFGTMPGQYSTGLLSKYKIVETKQWSDIKWRDFNPNIEPSVYQDANGNPLPSDMELFDKNFTDTIVEIEGRKVHVITLHTVPAFNFGNDQGPNLKRNADQLRFMEWYLTGSTDITVGSMNISTLNKSDLFIAMGDWNVGIHDDKEGAQVLQSLSYKIQLPLISNSYTNETQNFSPKTTKLYLDYIGFSKNFKMKRFEILNQAKYHFEHGCDIAPPLPNRADNVVATYSKGSKTCYIEVDQDYYHLKNASDHYPIVLELELI